MRRWPRDDGASAVEFALIVPVFLMLVFGMISAGLILNTKLSLVHAADEASRYGATVPTTLGGLNAYLTNIANVAEAAGGDALSTSAPNRVICVAYVNGQTGTTRRRMNGVFSNSSCFSDGRPAAEARVQVMVSRDVSWQMFLIPAWTINLSSDSVSRYEVIPAP
jgi:Flp pilus assembly protein TadG